MLTKCTKDSFDFGTVERRAVVGAFDGCTITSDAGALLLGRPTKPSVSCRDWRLFQGWPQPGVHHSPGASHARPAHLRHRARV